VLLLSKIDLISQHEREELIAILRSLNARAQIVPMVMGQVPLSRILDTGLFDFDQARKRRAGCRSCAANMCRKPKSTASPPPPGRLAGRFTRNASSTLSTRPGAMGGCCARKGFSGWPASTRRPVAGRRRAA
jgi:hypothetical protein